MIVVLVVAMGMGMAIAMMMPMLMSIKMKIKMAAVTDMVTKMASFMYSTMSIRSSHAWHCNPGTGTAPHGFGSTAPRIQLFPRLEALNRASGTAESGNGRCVGLDRFVLCFPRGIWQHEFVRWMC